MNVPSLQFCAIPDHYNCMTYYLYPLIPWILQLMSVAHCRFWNFAGSSGLSKSKAGSSRSFDFTKPILRTTWPALNQSSTYIAPRNHGGLARRSTRASVAWRGPPSSSPARVCARALVAEGGHQDTKYLAPVGGRCGALIPSLPPLWGGFTPAAPRLRPGHLQAAPPVRNPSAQRHFPPRRAWSRRTLSGCRKELILRSFAIWCCWS
jgi:hypothetical protein